MIPRPEPHVCESCGYPSTQPLCEQCALYAVAAAQLDALDRTLALLEREEARA